MIIDGNSLINRAFYALPPLTASDGNIYNAVYGFVNILARMITDYQPQYLCVAFDAGRHTFRNDLYADYKGTRKGMPDELASQLPVLKEMLNKMDICILEKSGIEADDIIGTLTRKFDDVKSIIITGDRDCLQLINEKTEVWLTKHGISEIVDMNERHLLDEWGLKPSQIIDLKALMGDASDNIPGVAGIGEKGAKALLNEWGTVQNIYANLDKIGGKVHEKLVNGREMCMLSYDLATIRTNVDIDVTLEQCKYTFPWDNSVYEMFTKCEFRSLLKRKDLFSGNNAMVDSTEFSTIDISFNDLKGVIEKHKDAKTVAIAFTKDEFHFAFDDSPNYMINLFGISAELVFSGFKDILGDNTKVLYTYNLKLLYHMSDRLEIPFKINGIDVPLAMYLINSNIREDIPTVLLNYLGLPDKLLATGLMEAWKKINRDLEKKDLFKLYTEIELPLVKVLFEMEREGITINTEVLDELAPKYKAEIEKIKDRIVFLADEDFNINSPKQLGTILFEKLHLPDRNNKKHSTAVDVLESLSGEHPIIDEILRYRTITKLYSTYIEGMRQYIRADGKIHTIFNQTTAVTGRLSSNEPNLQNIPVRTEEGRELRKMFVASKGCQLLSADYSQIELRLLAHYSGDPVLCKAYQEGLDIHTATAAQIFGVNINDVTPEMRRSAKAVNFGIIYGISPYGLAQNLGVNQSVAREYIDKYFKTYPTIKQFLDSSVEMYKQKGYVSTLFGRIRTFDNVVPNSRDARFSERAAMNMPLQGTASDIIKIAMLNVRNELIKRNLKTKLILQIHDELILDVPNNEIDEVRELVREKMENVAKLRIPLIVEIDVGPSWYDI